MDYTHKEVVINIYIKLIDNFDVNGFDCLDQDEKEIFLKSYSCLLDLSLQTRFLGLKKAYNTKKDYQDLGLLPNDKYLKKLIRFLKENNLTEFKEFFKYDQ